MNKTGIIYYGVAFIFYAGLFGILIYYACRTDQVVSLLFIEKNPELWMSLICPFVLLIMIYFSVKNKLNYLILFLCVSFIIVSHILYEIMNGPTLFLIPLILVSIGMVLDAKILCKKN